MAPAADFLRSQSTQLREPTSVAQGAQRGGWLQSWDSTQVSWVRLSVFAPELAPPSRLGAETAATSVTSHCVPPMSHEVGGGWRLRRRPLHAAVGGAVWHGSLALSAVCTETSGLGTTFLGQTSGHGLCPQTRGL